MKIPVGIPIFVAAAGVDPRFARLVHRYMLSAVAWLLLGTGAGLLEAFRFNYPDHLAVSWLSYGRLRPIHTGMVLWGWASLVLLGISTYVVPRSCRTNLYSLTASRVALWLWNIALALGAIALSAGQNNGNQEYREFPVFLRVGGVPLPVVPLLAVSAVLTAWNFYKTIASRTVTQIYISNWFMLGAPLFAAVLVGFGWFSDLLLPFWPSVNRGAGQPIMQGWYMHNAVGMWFTPLAVGATYYTLPKLLNKPIYSYGLGVLGFWTHLVFYTLIGTHHYVFSAVPSWLQTTAIIFSTAMMVPVWASTGNFLLTMRGERSAIRISYSLPFMLIGAIGYGLASVQGTAEAFKAANEWWHFTDYTVGHAHLAMVGFVSFLVWGSVYGLLPRVTGKEPNVELVGVHFWMSLIGLLIMVFSLCVGGAERGESWIAGEPFIESVRKMVPFWVWRFVGGSFMALGHLVFAWNVWSMRPGAFVDVMPQPPPTEPPAGEPAAAGVA